MKIYIWGTWPAEPPSLPRYHWSPLCIGTSNSCPWPHVSSWKTGWAWCARHFILSKALWDACMAGTTSGQGTGRCDHPITVLGGPQKLWKGQSAEAVALGRSPCIPVCRKVFIKPTKIIQKNLKSQILWDLRRDQQNSVILWVINFLKEEKVLH